MAAQPRPRLSDTGCPCVAVGTQACAGRYVPGIEWPQGVWSELRGAISGSRAAGGEAPADPGFSWSTVVGPHRTKAWQKHHWNPALFVYHSNRVSSRRQSHRSKIN